MKVIAVIIVHAALILTMMAIMVGLTFGLKAGYQWVFSKESYTMLEVGILQISALVLTIIITYGILRLLQYYFYRRNVIDRK